MFNRYAQLFIHVKKYYQGYGNKVFDYFNNLDLLKEEHRINQFTDARGVK